MTPTGQPSARRALVHVVFPAALIVFATALAAPASAEAFHQLPPGAALTGAVSCANQAFTAEQSWGEQRPDNADENLKIGKGTFDGHVDGTSYDSRYGTRVQGNSTMSSGADLTTTREVLSWGACKWGLSSDITFARAVQESYWHMSQLGDQTYNSSDCAYLGLSTPCYTSYGILQIKGTVHKTTYPMSQHRTPFNVDYTNAWQRACVDGDFTWLGSSYVNSSGSTRDWGCVGAWFSGNWYDQGAQQYISQVKTILANRTWEQPGF